MEGLNIMNTCLHELYEEQANYNSSKLGEEDNYSFETEKNNPTVTIPSE